MKKIIWILILVFLIGGALAYFKKGSKAEPLIYKDLIQINQPLRGDRIQSPLSFSGLARGPWYFEANFPVQVTDEERNVLGTGIATAMGEWMTIEFVPFSGEVTFEKPKSKKGFIVFMKSNASGLPEHDDFVEIPIVFE